MIVLTFILHASAIFRSSMTLAPTSVASVWELSVSCGQVVDTKDMSVSAVRNIFESVRQGNDCELLR